MLDIRTRMTHVLVSSVQELHFNGIKANFIRVCSTTLKVSVYVFKTIFSFDIL